MRLFVWPRRAQEVPGEGLAESLIRPAAVARRDLAPGSADGAGDAFGVMSSINLLDEGAVGALQGLSCTARGSGVGRIVMSSGWIASDEHTISGDDVDFRTHSGAGYRQLEEVLAQV